MFDSNPELRRHPRPGAASPLATRLGLWALGAALLATGTAHAEGTRDLIGGDPGPLQTACLLPEGEGACPYQGLAAATRLFVDILEPAEEYIVWCSAKGSRVEVIAPDGTRVVNPDSADGSFAPGERIDPLPGVGGAYEIVRYEDDEDLGAPNSTRGDQYLLDGDNIEGKYAWDLQVFSEAGGCGLAESRLCDFDRSCERPGRVFSTRWLFHAGSFVEGAATNASYYALVPGGAADETAVVELDLEGLAGSRYEISGNRAGVDGSNGGRSVFQPGESVTPEHRLYLNPPEIGGYATSDPTVSELVAVSGAQACGAPGSGLPALLAPGVSTIEFRFDSNVEGTYQLVCDLNAPAVPGGAPGDGRFDVTDDEDLLLNGVIGGPDDGGAGDCVFDEDDGVWRCAVPWDGIDNAGNPIPSGDSLASTVPISCTVFVTVGEFHYVSDDIETSFPGLRFFEVARTGSQPSNFRFSRASVPMFWNDASVQRCAVELPNDFWGAGANPFGALRSGESGLASGDYDDLPVPLASEGRDGALITADSGDAANARAWGNFVSSAAITDCPLQGNGKGNNAFLDTYTFLGRDQSNVVVIESIDALADADGEGLIDHCEVCILGTDPDESDSDDDNVSDRIEAEGCVPGIDTDGDGDDDALDPDDDDDTIPTRDEDGGSGDPTSQNTDRDTLPDYLDDDDDGDCVPTALEDVDGDGDPTNDDTDDNGIPDYLDDDDDGDEVPTCDEDVDVDGDPTNDNTDDDEVPNYLDADDDGDGIPTADEEPAIDDGDPTNDDTDSDDVPNYLDADDDGDLVPTALEDLDGDGDFDEHDTDANTIPDYLDDNDDGDVLSTREEDLDGDGDPTNDDTDGDGVPNYLDADDEDGPLGDLDNDGVANDDDNCPEIANSDQSDIDGDGPGDVCDDDIDGDEIVNDDDNCPSVANVDQTNTDVDLETARLANPDGAISACGVRVIPEEVVLDELGDACDDDLDGDGVPNDSDNCVSTPNALQLDFNDDGIGDACQDDTDEDLVPDAYDNCPEVCNAPLELGQPQADIDGDLLGDPCDPDRDGDGLTNDDEINLHGTNPNNDDTDSGGVPDGEELARGSNPLDPGDDPGAFQVQGGRLFCQSTIAQRPSGGSAGGFDAGLGLLVGLLAFLGGRRRNRRGRPHGRG